MITYAMGSMPGDREYNEDFIGAEEEEDVRLYVLADGLGGCGRGDLASKTAVEAALKCFREEERGEGFLDAAFCAAEDAVVEAQSTSAETRRMNTTLTALLIDKDTARWAHVGDSRVYMFRNGKVMSQTLDHSVPQMLVNLGEIRPEEIRHHPDRNRLLHSVGQGWDDDPPYEVSEPVELRKGDAFLLCSDGFWEYITEKEMCRLLRKSESAQEWLDQMKETVAREGKGSHMDNYSAICVQYGKSGRKLLWRLLNV